MIILPRWVLDELRDTAQDRGMEVVEYVRQCVIVEREIEQGDVKVRLPSGKTVRVLHVPNDGP